MSVIRERYTQTTPVQTKAEQLRALDRSVSRPARVVAITLGTVGAIVLGVGMCCVMVWGDRFFALGVVVGIVGIAIAALSYPMYLRVEARRRERLAPQILALADELLG